MFKAVLRFSAGRAAGEQAEVHGMLARTGSHDVVAGPTALPCHSPCAVRNASGLGLQRSRSGASGMLLHLQGSLGRVASMIALHDLQRGERGQ